MADSMGSVKTKAVLQGRARKRRFVESVAFPRWVVAGGVVLIGFMLFLATISDPDGKLRAPRFGEYLLLAGVLLFAAALARIDSKRWSIGKQYLAALIRRRRHPNRFRLPETRLGSGKVRRR